MLNAMNAVTVLCTWSYVLKSHRSSGCWTIALSVWLMQMSFLFSIDVSVCIMFALD